MKTLDNLQIPLIQGGMGVGISMGSLAGHVAKEGGMGVISTASIGFREPDFTENPLEAGKRALKAEIKKAREISEDKGLIAINAMVATTHYEEMVRTACESGIDAVICGAGLPLNLPEIAKQSDVLLAPVVSSGKAAKTIMRFWNKNSGRKPDFFVVEGHMAGGHLGFTYEEAVRGTDPTLEDIVGEVVEAAQVSGETKGIPVFAAGSVYSSEDIYKVKKAGAYGIQIATPFIATQECDATQGFKDVILSGNGEDAVIIKSPVGMPGRALRTPLTEKAAKGERVSAKKCVKCIKTCNPSDTHFCISQALVAAFYGDYENGLFFCGGNVGKINEMTTVKAVMDRFAEEWRKI